MNSEHIFIQLKLKYLLKFIWHCFLLCMLHIKQFIWPTNTFDYILPSISFYVLHAGTPAITFLLGDSCQGLNTVCLAWKFNFNLWYLQSILLLFTLTFRNIWKMCQSKSTYFSFKILYTLFKLNSLIQSKRQPNVTLVLVVNFELVYQSILCTFM